MAKKSTHKPATIVNRRAKFDYQLDDNLVVGLVLSGPEVRAVRDGRVSLKGAFVTLRGGELYLNNASFSLKNNDKSTQAMTVSTEPRKLLATRKQIDELERARQSGLAIVPTKMITQRRYIKLEIATGKGKKTYDKRQTIKQRQQERESKRAIGSLTR